MFVLVIEKRPGIDQGYAGTWVAANHSSNGIKVRGDSVGATINDLLRKLDAEDRRLEMIADLDGGDDDSI